MYTLLAILITVVTAPIWIPVAIYIALSHDWTDTVPKQEDL